jgi:glucose dehydrogenase
MANHAAMRGIAVSAVTAMLCLDVAHAADVPRGEWRAYAGDTRATKYSPLDQINA